MAANTAALGSLKTQSSTKWLSSCIPLTQSNWQSAIEESSLQSSHSDNVVTAVAEQWQVELLMAANSSLDRCRSNSIQLHRCDADPLAFSMETTLAGLGSVDNTRASVTDGNTVFVNDRRNTSRTNRDRSVLENTDLWKRPANPTCDQVDLTIVLNNVSRSQRDGCRDKAQQ